ncbi:hypothetical protein ONZ45_g6693 [Pleurotus djamor]|nr:hypothetical protein ONZ45_g6693 [Pleurotus djamor]
MLDTASGVQTMQWMADEGMGGLHCTLQQYETRFCYPTYLWPLLSLIGPERLNPHLPRVQRGDPCHSCSLYCPTTSEIPARTQDPVPTPVARDGHESSRFRRIIILFS